jgi:hypothetical protein
MTWSHIERAFHNVRIGRAGAAVHLALQFMFITVCASTHATTDARYQLGHPILRVIGCYMLASLHIGMLAYTAAWRSHLASFNTRML